jgi:hypothetical protein
MISLAYAILPTLVGLQIGVEPQLISVLPTNQISIQQNYSKASDADIAQTFQGNCDKVRYISSLQGLGLSNDEIEALGSGSSIRLNKERLSRIHQIFSQLGTKESETRAEGQDGLFWFIPNADSYGFSPGESRTSQLVQKTKSLKNSSLINQPLYDQVVDLLVQSGSGSKVGFSYNFGGRTCTITFDLQNGGIHY